MARSACVTVLVGLMLAALQAPSVSAARKRSRRPKTVRVALLPVQVAGVPVETARRLGKLLHDELDDIGIFNLASGKLTARKLARLKRRGRYGPDCHENKQCIRRVGRSLAADVVYFMKLTRSEAEVDLVVQTFDVRSGKEIRRETGTAGESDEDLDRSARWLVRKVSSPMITTLMKGKGRLLVACEEEDATLYINDKPFGKRTNKSFKVSPGVFDVVVKKEGFESFHDVVVVKPNQTKEIVATFPDTGPPELPGEIAADTRVQPQPKPKPQPFLPDTTAGRVKPEREKQDDDRFYETWWFWTLVGAGVAGAVTTVTVVALSGDDGGGGAKTGGAVMTWE